VTEGGVVVREHGQITEIVLDRPESHNALSTRLAGELAAACQRTARDPVARAAVLTSTSPRAFCVGADLKERDGFDDSEFLAQRAVFRSCFGAVRDLAVPVIAAVHGFALGGGYELAMCCDLIVADESAVLGLPETTLGIVPGGGGTQLLSRRAGLSTAMDLVLTGRRVTIAEAERLRLIDRRVPAGSDRAAALERAALIAANSPVAVRNAKRAIRRSLDVDLAAGLDIEDSAWRATVFSADRREGVRAFVEKRTPEWP
jgi:enoyl-CoA hydratase/carnithine racemase